MGSVDVSRARLARALVAVNEHGSCRNIRSICTRTWPGRLCGLSNTGQRDLGTWEGLGRDWSSVEKMKTCLYAVRLRFEKGFHLTHRKSPSLVQSQESELSIPLIAT